MALPELEDSVIPGNSYDLPEDNDTGRRFCNGLKLLDQVKVRLGNPQTTSLHRVGKI